GLYFQKRSKDHLDDLILSAPERGLQNFSATTRWVLASLFFLLAFIRLATEFRLFFFNEPFVSGLLFIVLGLTFSIKSLMIDMKMERGKFWLLVGPIILMFGIYNLSLAVFHVQLPFASRFQLIYAITGLAFLYYSLVVLNKKEGRAGIAIGFILILFALLLEVHVLPVHFLLVVTQFFDFFYPLLFAVF